MAGLAAIARRDIAVQRDGQVVIPVTNFLKD
jgi:hypothetical protein